MRSGDRIDIKLGPGGLSDVEWTVQLLQLTHGGTHPEVRVPGAARALPALAQAGLLGGEEAVWLREGWRRLTLLRNQLHLAGFRDSSMVPPGPREQERMAAMLGYDGSQAFLEDLGRTMRRVRKVHERAFYDA